MIKALFFGPVAEILGQRVLEIEHRSGLTLEMLKAQLAVQYPDAFQQVSFVAINGVQARDASLTIDDGSEIAFMAKFSGG